MTYFVQYDHTTGNILWSGHVHGTAEDEAAILAQPNMLQTEAKIDPMSNVIDLTTKSVKPGTPAGIVKATNGRMGFPASIIQSAIALLAKAVAAPAAPSKPGPSNASGA